MIQQLKEDRQKMLEENSRLQAVNTQLQLDNATLQQENTELKTKLGMGITDSSTDIQLHLDLPPSPVYLPPTPCTPPSPPPPSPPPLPSPCSHQHQHLPPQAPHSNLLSQQHSLMTLSSRSRVAVCHTKPPGCRRKA